MENVDSGGDDEGDEDEDEEDHDDRNDEKSQAACVYKHALKVLKFKLYFEDFFPTDDDKGALVYDCWMAGARVTKGLSADPGTLKWMLYHFKHDKTVRTPLVPDEYFS